ncbi:hypothetical protein LCGC14_1514550 [marine sediment metagenome]|uniref:Uncharacterized protein n=1 Tax=marine sediment metagenome TaxID=412755 RepID=A0A0F9M1J2_9ZZZZ
MNKQLVKRIKSLLWRAAMMGIAAFVLILSDGITGLGLNPLIVGVLGLVFGEISKYLNKQVKK